MTGSRFRGYAKSFQYPHGAKADCTNGRLGNIRGSQGFVLLFGAVRPEGGGRIYEVGQVRTVSSGEAALCRSYRCKHLGESAGHITQHAGVLGALAGEKYAEFARCLSGGIAGTIRAAPGGCRTLAQHGQSIGT